MSTISVLVVDDHRVFADAVRARLSAEPELQPVTIAYSAADAETELARTRPDVAVLDYMLGDNTGAAVAERVREISPGTRVVILSAVESIDSVVDALVRGVVAWLPKTVDTGQLVRVIRGVAAGEAWLDPALLGKVLPRLLDKGRNPAPDPLDVLTPREREVLDCMVAGLNRVEIANRLGMSGNTVRTHSQNLIRKLGAHSVLEAVTIVLRSNHQPATPLH